MCGRFTLSANAQRLKDAFPMFELWETQCRYNIAPTQMVLAVKQVVGDKPTSAFLRWGLIPSWAKDKKIGGSLNNARADGVASQPSFRAAFKRRRCLVLADGFYEWGKGATPKQPFHIRMSDGSPFAFAGLWERWSGEYPAVESCTIITTDANEVLRPLHDRMPVILNPRDYGRWLDPANADPGVLQEMLRPYSPEHMTAVGLSTFVNNSRNEGEQCLTPA